MQIGNDYNTNFKGGYKFIRMPKAARENLNTLIPKGKTIYDGFEGKKSNVFLIARDSHHNTVANFIKDNKLNYRYYPEIKAEMDFKLGHPEKASELIQTMTPETIDFEQVAIDSMPKVSKNSIKKQNKEQIENILDSLKLDMDKSTLKTKFGARIFQNGNHTKSICVSAPTSEQVRYVKINHLVSSSNQRSVEMYEMNADGKIIRDYTNDIDNWGLFNKKFNETLVR